MRVPHDALSPGALRALVEDFVTRDGTDYGERETSLEDKVGQVMRMLQTGRATIVYDVESESCALALVDELRRVGA